jgi:hypothetical protein
MSPDTNFLRRRRLTGTSIATGTPRRVMRSIPRVLWTCSTRSKHFALNSEIGKSRIFSKTKDSIDKRADILQLPDLPYLYLYFVDQWANDVGQVRAIASPNRFSIFLIVPERPWRIVVDRNNFQMGRLPADRVNPNFPATNHNSLRITEQLRDLLLRGQEKSAELSEAKAESAWLSSRLRLLHLFNQRRNDVKQVPDNRVVCNLENRRFGIFIDCDDCA